jgi:hypothetical protein
MLVKQETLIYLIKIPIFERYVVWCGSKNGYQEDMYLIEIGLHAQNIITLMSTPLMSLLLLYLETLAP